MDYFLAEAILIAGNSDGEETFWVQMLVFVLLAGAWGVYSLVKTRANKSQSYGRQKLGNVSRFGGVGKRIRGLAEVGEVDFEVIEPPGRDVKRGRFTVGRDLAGGMEMLTVEFLLSVVEDTEGDDDNNVTMRKLSFNELVRRNQLSEVASESLKVYAVDGESLYGRAIQCEAMRELARRTTRVSVRV